MDLNHSVLGSYGAYAGFDRTDLDSIGETGGITGKFVGSFWSLIRLLPSASLFPSGGPMPIPVGGTNVGAVTVVCSMYR